MVRHDARVIGTVILLFALWSVPGAWAAGSPTDQLRDGVDRVFKILEDPTLKGEEKAAQRTAAIIKVAHEIFDFGEMAKRSLAQHWGERTATERGEFVRLFTALIQRSYVSKVDQHASERMIVRGETVDGGHAVVRTALPIGAGRELPLDYRMHNAHDRWQIYDLSIDGISLVANYRSQFNKVIRTSSYEALLAKMRSKVDFPAPSASASGEKSAR